jgi:hypothetical protein
VSVEVCGTRSQYFLRSGIPSLNLDVEAGMGTRRDRHSRRRRRLVLVLGNHVASTGGLLHRTVVEGKKYANCVEADDGDHAA